MTTIRLSPPVVDVCDILEYALAAIEEYGWRQGPRPVEPDREDQRKSWEKDVLPSGLSLHDAIGYAGLVLSGETGSAVGQGPRAGSKDYPLHSNAGQYGYHGTLRAKATAAVQKHLPSGENDQTFNDKAADVHAVTAVLRAAIKEECK